MNFIRVKQEESSTPLMMRELKGYTKALAIEEGNRCIQCKHRPCEQKGCPTQLPIPDIIKAIREDNLELARTLIDSRSALTSICSRVCFQANQCEGSCTIGIKGESVAIGLLERYVSENTTSTYKKGVSTGKKVAVIGSGPASIGASKVLLSNGIEVDIYEKDAKCGGILRYGIPEYRLPNAIVDQQIQELVDLGAIIYTNKELGKNILLTDLVNNYDAVFLGIGTSMPMKLGIEGEEHPDVFSAFEVLAAINEETHPMHQEMLTKFKDKTVKVVGGGNVAMDVSRCVARLSPKSVSIVYRRKEEQLPARPQEVEEAKMDGVQFQLLRNPFELVFENDHLVSVKCREMCLGEIGADGRASVSEIENSCDEMACDCLIIAIGSGAEKIEGIECDRRNRIILKENSHHTSMHKVYAAGDIVSGPLTVVHAMRGGMDSAIEITKDLEIE